MKPQLMRWQPVTCDCNLIQYKDENGNITAVSQQEAQAIHAQIFNDYPDTTKNPQISPQQPLKFCSAHSSLTDHIEVHNAMREEGRRLCTVYRVLLGLESVKGLGLDETKDGAVVLKQGIEYKWEFSGTGKDRVFSFQIVGATLTTNQKNAIKSLCDSKFGEGKVEFV